MPRSTLSVLSFSSFLHLAALVNVSYAVNPNITWVSPSEGDVYGSGDTIVGRWTADKAVASPSFSLCIRGGAQRRSRDGGGDSEDAEGGGSGEHESCGTAAWPTIEQSASDGSYMIHMSLPNVTATLQCYLEMVDESGKKDDSPTFSFGRSIDTVKNVSNDPDSTAASSSPFSSSPSPPSPEPSATASSSSNIQTSNDSDGDANANDSSPQTSPALAESHIPAPTAAYAVPLSLVVSVLVAAGGLSWHQRRKLRAERVSEQEAFTTRQQPSLSRHSTLSYAGFLALGSGRPRSGGGGSVASAESRSTSVSLMRAWRRDVSDRYARRDGLAGAHSGVADDEKDVAWSEWNGDDDGRSVASSGTSSKRKGYSRHLYYRDEQQRPQPRHATREPFYSSRSNARRTTIPANVFRAAIASIDPRHPHARHHAQHHYSARSRPEREYTVNDEWSKLRCGHEVFVSPDEKSPAKEHNEDRVNAAANDAVMSSYYEFSSIPLSPAAPSQETLSVTPPERLHVRRYAEVDDRKALPPSPRLAEKEIHGAVARNLARSPRR